MEDSKIIPENQPEEKDIEAFIEKISKDLTKKNKIEIYGKILNYNVNEKDINENIINLTFYIFKKTNINPFEKEIIMDIELSPNKIPYARIKTDFILPSLYDNRNFYCCLTNEHNYLYNPNNLLELEDILRDITNSGIENFLLCLKENIEIKTFVFYGEYELHSIYNMNDFLENSKLLKLYRINQIVEKGKEIEEKYLILTQLYILIFKPLEKDKTFAELIFMKNLKNVIFNYKKHLNKKVNLNTLLLYIQDIKTPNGKTYEIEFSLIDRSRPPVEKKEVLEEENEDEQNINENKQIIDAKNDTNNKSDTSSSSKDNSNKQNNNNVNKIEENDIWDKYYKFEEEIEKKQKEINFGKYKLIIENFRPLFNQRNNEEKNTKKIEFKNKIMEYEKMFQHCEKMYNYYFKSKDNKKYKKRMDYYMVKINFFCAELMGFFDMEKQNFQFYLDKMKYYLNLNEKNQ